MHCQIAALFSIRGLLYKHNTKAGKLLHFVQCVSVHLSHKWPLSAFPPSLCLIFTLYSFKLPQAR